MENKMVTPLGISVFWRNKETMPQRNGQNTEPFIVQNLVIQFNQEKFEELLSGGTLVLHARKHKKISVAKISEQKPALAGWVTGRALSPLLSASIEAKSVPHEQVPC